MLTAAEANRIAHNTRAAKKPDIKKLLRQIERAAKKGETFIQVPLITEDQAKGLRELGYGIRYSHDSRDPGSGGYYMISWYEENYPCQ